MYLARMATLAVSAVGLDRPGIIAGVAERLAAHGANITDSRMAILRGHFAMTLIVEGAERVRRLVRVDQKPIGRTPRSNLATYTGLFDHVRKLFAATPAARSRAAIAAPIRPVPMTATASASPPGTEPASPVT